MLLQEGVAAAKAGKKALARRWLLQAIERDPVNQIGLLWLASVAESPQDSIHYLERVLEIDPENERASSGLKWAKAQASRDLLTNGVAAAKVGEKAKARH